MVRLEGFSKELMKPSHTRWDGQYFQAEVERVEVLEEGEGVVEVVGGFGEVFGTEGEDDRREEKRKET